MKSYSIRPVPLMGWNIPKTNMTSNLGLGEVIPVIAYSWFIEGPDKKILVDTASRMQLLRFGNGSNFGTPESRLKELGLKCSDIDIVIVTHLHYEHIGYAQKYPQAKFYVQRSEYEFAVDPHPAFAIYYDKRLFEGLKFELLEGDQEIVPGVKVLSTPGHSSAGTQSVLVETGSGITGITGFCCIAQNFEPPVPMKTRDNIINVGNAWNPIQSYSSMLKFRDACDVIIACHDPEYAQYERVPDTSVTYTMYKTS
jgi:glyoxylase-like metal-dependent hydrolase (beta-lactamase superfamily II)